MNECVIDASVAAKWLLPEEYSEVARRLLSQSLLLRAPAHLPVELANVLWKKQRSGEITNEQAHEGLAHIEAAPVVLTSTVNLLAPALQLAISHDRSLYDCLYLALAVEHDCPLITADRRFYNAMADHFPDHLRWVGGLAPGLPGAS